MLDIDLPPASATAGDQLPQPPRAPANRTSTLRARELAIFVLDQGGRLASWSPGAAQITGYTAAEVVGQDLAILYEPKASLARQPAADLAKARRAGFVECEGWRIRKGGQLIWADTLLTAMRDDSGVVTGFVCILRDLTETEAAEARKRARAERLAALTATQRDLASHGFDIAMLLPRVVARARELCGKSVV